MLRMRAASTVGTRRPLVAAVAVSAVLHLGLALWAWAASPARQGDQEPGRAPVSRLNVQLRPSHEPLAPATTPAPARSTSRAAVPPRLRRQLPAVPAPTPAATSAAPLQNEPAIGDAPPEAQKSLADILKVLPAVTREVAARRAPNEALAASGSKGRSVFTPLEQALTREQPGEQRLANGLVRVVTKWGTYCVRERWGEPGAGTVVMTCP